MSRGKVMKISEKIKKVREEKGMSQEVLAKKSSVTLATISRLENGHYEPHLATLKAIATAFNMLVRDLLEGVK
jgi:transcriptional regulator with XRE-family HTH domain